MTAIHPSAHAEFGRPNLLAGDSDMRVGDAMTRSPASCEPTTPLRLVAQLMMDHECAAIPVTESGRLVGIVTDRDIACRAVALRDDALSRTSAGA
jgi:CBS domain-containing protein